MPSEPTVPVSKSLADVLGDVLPIFADALHSLGLFGCDEADFLEEDTGLNLRNGNREDRQTHPIFQCDLVILACGLRTFGHRFAERVELLGLVAPVRERDDGEFFFLHLFGCFDERDEEGVDFLFHLRDDYHRTCCWFVRVTSRASVPCLLHL